MSRIENFENDATKAQEDSWISAAVAQIWSKPAAQPQAKVQEAAACFGQFTSPPGADAFKLQPPQIGINGGFAVFNLPCDHDKIKALKNFKPYA